MTKKYEFTGEVKIEFEVKFHRIRALVAIAAIGVAAGDLGGWIESEKNLSQVSGDAWVSGDAQVSGDALVSGNARVSGDARVSGNARVSGDAQVYDDARVYGNARVSGNAWVYGNARVSGNAWVYGNARVSGNAWVSGDARYITVSPIGSENGCLTAFVEIDGTIKINRGCFTGTIEEFLAAVEAKHGNTTHGVAYRAAVDLIKARLDTSKDIAQ